MKRKLYLFAIAAVSVCVMTACGSKDSSKDKEKAGTEKVAEGNDEGDEDDGEEAAPKTKEGVIAMVRSLYDDANTIYSPSEDGMEANIDLVGEYCSKKFNELVSQIREIDVEKGEPGLCEDWNGLLSFYDEAPIEPKDFDVTIDGNTAMANFELVHGDESATHSFALVYEDGQWRIDDIEQRGIDGYSKVEQMTEYIEENK